MCVFNECLALGFGWDWRSAVTYEVIAIVGLLASGAWALAYRRKQTPWRAVFLATAVLTTLLFTVCAIATLVLP